MKLTIIPVDGAVYKDGISYNDITWAGTPANIHALQWLGNDGWVEYNDGTANESITVLPEWANNALTAWEVANTPLPDPEPQIPSVVSMRQARLALLQEGLLATVNTAIEAGSEADKITWEYATEVNRSEPLVQNMAVSLGVTQQQMDDLFTLASTL